MFRGIFAGKDNLFALIFFIISVFAFFIWGYNYIPSNHLLLFILASVFGIFMAFNIGGNDVANSFGTSVGAKTLTIKQALIIAAVFELSGAIFAGGEVTSTIRSGIISLSDQSLVPPMAFAGVMMGALFSAGAWLFVATKFGMPVSTTHSIVGGIIGAGITMGMIHFGTWSDTAGLIKWSKVLEIVASWFISPVAGGIIAYMVFGYVKTKIITPSVQLHEKVKALKKERKTYKNQYFKELSTKSEAEQLSALRKVAAAAEEDDEDDITNTVAVRSEYRDQLRRMKKNERSIDVLKYMRMNIPIVAACGAAVVSASLLFKGLKNLKLDFSVAETLWMIFVISICAYLISFAIVNMIKKDNPIKGINRVFGWFQIFTASSFAFSHGANDIANAVGPFAAILDVLKTSSINSSSPVPFIAMATFGVALVVGLWFLGKEVITTVGSKLAHIEPTTGFSAELASSVVILVATHMGLPISSTHVLIGAVLGIGLYNKSANWSLLKPIGLAWVITIPAAMLGSAFCYWILHMLLID